jgi:glycosyltransferase involved in cell wall biosynthesis
MKIYIAYKQTEQAWGGGNQFLKALRQEFLRKGVLADTAADADAVLYNGYQELGALILGYIFNHRTKRVYRLGPVMSLHRKGIKWKFVDRLMVWAANWCADVVIFQSQWSLAQARQRGFKKTQHVCVIPNAVDSTIFYPAEKMPSEKIRLLYVSWSKNQNKGFSFLSALDRRLDFQKYSMTFVGNTPISFTNIETVPPVTSAALADTLRMHDIFISPTKDDACSNAILEALACGLPVVALDSGGNSELVQQGGVLFTDESTFLTAVDTARADVESYRSRITILSMEAVADRYLEAIRGSIKA